MFTRYTSRPRTAKQNMFYPPTFIKTWESSSGLEFLGSHGPAVIQWWQRAFPSFPSPSCPWSWGAFWAGMGSSTHMFKFQPHLPTKSHPLGPGVHRDSMLYPPEDGPMENGCRGPDSGTLGPRELWPGLQGREGVDPWGPFLALWGRVWIKEDQNKDS